MPARWSLRLLGGFELVALPGGASAIPLGKRERLLLAYLSLSPKFAQPRRKLATLLWGDANDETLLDNLRLAVWKLRKALGDSEHRVLASEGDDIVLDGTTFEVDVLAFRRLATQPGRAELEAAAALSSGEFLDGLDIDSEEFESWRRAEATRSREQLIDVLTRLMAHLSACGENERAIEIGMRILRLEPLHEEAVRRLMRLYGVCGRRGAAIQLYRTFADALRTELDAQPESETRAVFAEIARGGEDRTDLPPPKIVTHPSDGLSGPPRPSTPRAVRLHSPLAALAVVAIVATALISYRPFALFGSPDGVVAERIAAADPASAISIAVLPFLNLSGDVGQEFFSDGMTEEITSALAMVPDLKVVARTSAFQFKGEKSDMRMVGQALNATHLIEGSVRREGDRVRITAQLIDARTGNHTWAERYDREMQDIFTLQEEISRSIAAIVGGRVEAVRRDRAVRANPASLRAYDLVLRAKAFTFKYTKQANEQARAFAQQAIAIDPSSARAHAFHGYSCLMDYVLRCVAHPEHSLAQAYESGKTAIALDGDDIEARCWLGHALLARGNFEEAHVHFVKALELNPQFGMAYFLRGQFRENEGELIGAGIDAGHAAAERGAGQGVDGERHWGADTHAHGLVDANLRLQLERPDVHDLEEPVAILHGFSLFDDARADDAVDWRRDRRASLRFTSPGQLCASTKASTRLMGGTANGVGDTVDCMVSSFAGRIS
jgi:TolB-like protein/DNA-binding SARP family transcriptional activator